MLTRVVRSSLLPSLQRPASLVGTKITGRTMSSSSLSTTEQLQSFGERHVTKGIGRIAPGVMKKAEGSYVEYLDGKRMLDFTCGIGVTNLGHCHPKVSKAAAEQCMQLVHGQCSISFHEPYLRLIEKLLPIMPHPSLDSFFFWNSGSEAVEAALKMARATTGRQNIICMQGGYHGRTFGAMAVTRSKTGYSEGFHPLMPGVFVTPYPFWHQLGLSPSTPTQTLTQLALNQLHLLLQQQTSPSDTAAIIIEPVLGEGGYVPAPKEFLVGLREVCDEYGILLIVDEVQSGFGRTGAWWAIEGSESVEGDYEGSSSSGSGDGGAVRPDILVMAKGLANGFPLSGVVSRKEVTDKLKPGSMGGTYAGNAVSCAAACAVIDAMEEERVLENVKERSKHLLTSLHALQSDPALAPYILDVRGRGLMVAVEFASPAPLGGGWDPVYQNQDTGKPIPPNLATRVAKKCIEKGLLLLTTSVYEVVRFIPALNIGQGEMERGVGVFEDSLREVVGGWEGEGK